MRRFGDFAHAIEYAQEALFAYGAEVDTGHWQGVHTEGKPDLVTMELMNFSFHCPLPNEGTIYDNILRLRSEIVPNLPWADTEFAERVGGEPHNPHHSLPAWPWWKGQWDSTTSKEKFSHTYSERFWPKRAGDLERIPGQEIHGIRYQLGDFDNLVDLLAREPKTRQAYLPIFFPEDTGAAHGGRIPCTLGYQFLFRNERLHMWYFIRSCDFVRHFRDDLYMAARLADHLLSNLASTEESPGLWHDARPGNFHFVCASLHIHKGDAHLVQ